MRNRWLAPGRSGPRRGPRRGWRVAAGLCAAIPLIDLFAHHHAVGASTDAVVIGLVLVAAASLLVSHGRRPITVAVVTGACALAVLALGYRMPTTAGAPVTALYAVGTVGRHARSLAASGLAIAGTLLARVLSAGWNQPVPGEPVRHEPLLAQVLSVDTLAHSALAAVPVLCGAVVALRRTAVALLAQRAELAVSAERAAQRLLIERERRRIARDLHDIVGQALTTINVQASVATRLLPGQPDFAREALEEISTASRAALADLRGIVGVLRDLDAENRSGDPNRPGSRPGDPNRSGSRPGDPNCPGEPRVGLGDLAGLVDRARRFGVDATLTMTGDPVLGLPRSIQVAGYRIVQESLTNVRKHAGPIPAQIAVEVGQRQVTIRVSNGPGPRRAGAATLAAPTPGGRITTASRVSTVEQASRHNPADLLRSMPTAGAGLAGMRERVLLLGGTLTAGPTPDGGFEILARLPLPDPAAE